MCSGKPTEGVPFNHKLGTVAKVVEDAIINKDPLKVEHEVGPAKKAVISLNHTKNNDEMPLLSDNDMDEEVNESTYEEQISGPAEDLIKSGACSSLPLQAKETSNKPPQTSNSSTNIEQISEHAEDLIRQISEHAEDLISKFQNMQKI